MKPTTPKDETTEERAALWAARLDGSELTAADRAELDLWLAADPAHRLLLSSYCQFSTDLEQQLPLLAGIRDESADFSTTVKPARPLPWLRWPILAGATLTAAAVAVVILWQGRPQNHFQDIAVPAAQRQEVALADGTRVELNARTTVSVTLGPDTRHVRLTEGEAFFRVAKDSTRPFVVETAAGAVRVTGTEFNVRAESPASLAVTVLEGSVQAQPGGTAPQVLRAGDQLVTERQRVRVTALTPTQLNDALAWRQGQVVFDATPLREALGSFARYHGRNLTVSDSVALQRVGGRYSVDDLDGFLNFIEEQMNMRVIRLPDGAVQVNSLNGT